MARFKSTSSQEDRLAKVRYWLNDPELGKWSDRYIADQCGVSHYTVGRERARNGKPVVDTIYFIYAEDAEAIKIGYSRSPHARFNTIQAAPADNGSNACDHAGNTTG